MMLWWTGGGGGGGSVSDSVDVCSVSGEKLNAADVLTSSSHDASPADGLH